MQWTNVNDFTATSGDFTFQAVLFETSNRIEVRIGPVPNPLALSPSIGVQDSTGANGSNIYCGAVPPPQYVTSCVPVGTSPAL